MGWRSAEVTAGAAVRGLADRMPGAAAAGGRCLWLPSSTEYHQTRSRTPRTPRPRHPSFCEPNRRPIASAGRGSVSRRLRSRSAAPLRSLPTECAFLTEHETDEGASRRKGRYRYRRLSRLCDEVLARLIGLHSKKGERRAGIMTPVDFVHAHLRHWKDAEILLGRRRLANADQLYGFSAECGLKAVMEALGKPLLRKHVQELWPEFKRSVRGRAACRFRRQLPGGSPFFDWSPDDRYAPVGYLQSSAVAQHRIAALGVRRMVQRARQDGTL